MNRENELNAKVLEIREQITNWEKQRDNIDDMIEQAHFRIDEITEEIQTERNLQTV